MKINGNMILWKKNALILGHIVFALFTIVAWQPSNSSAQDWATCVKPVNIPTEIEVVILNQDSPEKSLINKTDEHWFQYFFANKDDHPEKDDPDFPDTNGEDHSINMIDPNLFNDVVDLSWEVYRRDGTCIATGRSGERFGPSLEDLTPPPGADPLPSDIYFIRIIWDPDYPQKVFEEITYFFNLSGTGIPKVYGIIQDAFNNQELGGVIINSIISQTLSTRSGFYMVLTPDGIIDLNYIVNGYKQEEIVNLSITASDHIPQDVILCPDEVVINATPTSGIAPLDVKFDLPDVTNSLAEFQWDFNNDRTVDSIDPAPIFTYSSPGTYTVNVAVSATLPTSASVTNEINCTVTSSVSVIVENPPPPVLKDEIIGTWNNGIWNFDLDASLWAQMTSFVTTGDIAAGEFTGDGKADVASSWDGDGLWYQDGATLDWIKIDDIAPFKVTAGDVTGDGRDEIIGSWDDGIRYWDVITSTWTQMTAFVTTGDIAAGEFTGDGKADVASSWGSLGLWYQDGATLDWIKIDDSAPFKVTAGDVTGDGRDEIIGSWDDGIRYWDVTTSTWTQMTAFVTTGDIAAGEFTGDGKADVASSWGSLGLWYQDGATLDWIKVENLAPFSLTAGNLK